MSQSILEESRQAKKRGLAGLFTKKKIIVFIILLLAAGGAYYYYHTKNTKTVAKSPTLRQWTVKNQDLKISVQETGNVVSKDQVSLSFPVSGNLEVDHVYVKQGDTVKQGDKIASVKTDTLALSLKSAENNYQSAIDNLKAKEEPPTDSEISSAKASISQAEINLQQAQLSLTQTTNSAKQSVANAQASLQSAENNLQLNSSVNDSAIVSDAYTSLLNTMRSQVVKDADYLKYSDSILGIDDTLSNVSFKSLLGVMDPNALNSAKLTYRTAKSQVDSLSKALDSLTSSSSQASIDQVASQDQTTLETLREHFQYMQEMLNATVTGTNLSQTQLDGFRSSNSSNLSAINSAISSLNSSVQSVASAKRSLSNLQITYDTAQRNLEQAQEQAQQNIANAQISVKSKELALSQAQQAYKDLMTPPTALDLASAKNQVNSAAIQVQQAQHNMDQATLVSPIDGVVSLLNYKEGDIILNSNSSDNTVATIINTNTLYVEANVQEADISQIKVGDKAEVGFDAINGLTLQGKVSYISLTSTTSSNGIVSYLVRVSIDNPPNSPVRQGMTATINFITAEAPNSLVVPVSAVRNVDNKPSVEMANGQFVPVTTGFTDGTNVAVLSGLKAGDVILY